MIFPGRQIVLLVGVAVIIGAGLLMIDSGSVITVTLDPGDRPAPISRAAPDRNALPAPAQPLGSAADATAPSRLRTGTRYAALVELVEDQRAAGFVRIGHFGGHWPAQVVEVRTDRDGIVFVKQDGVRHSYNGFDGYVLKMVRLQKGSQETIVVLRSLHKR